MNWRRIIVTGGLFMAVTIMTLVVVGYRSARVYQHAQDWQAQIKYLVETGDSIGTAPADSALSDTYLEVVFGDDPELLNALKQAVQRGTRESPGVLQGDVSAIIVTYRRNGGNEIENVAVHLMGEFPLGQRQISMHPGGFFAQQIDQHLWQTADAGIRFLGRDLVVWSVDEEDDHAQRDLISAFFSGEVVIIAESLVEKPMHYTAVLPAPRQLVPLKLRPHVRAIVMNGFLAPEEGFMETIFLTSSERASARVASILYDTKLSAEIALRTRFAGAVQETAWNPQHIPVWWSYEMANSINGTELVRRERTVTLTSRYQRRMVNAVLKTMERFGRDFSAIKGIQEDKLDPRVVDARMRTTKPNHYWSEAHRWGPDWPIPASRDVDVQRPDSPAELIDAPPPVTGTL